MNLINWIKNKKQIEEEIGEQDIQYSCLLKKYGKMEKEIDTLIERNDVLEDINTKHIETIGKLRKKITELKKELKDKN